MTIKPLIKQRVFLYLFGLFFSLVAASAVNGRSESVMDDRLEQWLYQKTSSSQITTDIREVIVYLKAPSFQDRTGLFRSTAIEEEELYSKDYLKRKAEEFLRLFSSHSSFLSQQKAEILWASHA